MSGTEVFVFGNPDCFLRREFLRQARCSANVDQAVVRAAGIKCRLIRAQWRSKLFCEIRLHQIVVWATVQNEIDPDAILAPLTVGCASIASAMQIRQRPSTENKMSAAHGHAPANFNPSGSNSPPLAAQSRLQICGFELGVDTSRLAARLFIRAFAIGISLNLAFVAIGAIYGWKVNLLALLADAATTSAM